MNIGLLSILHTQVFDFHRGLASNYAAALKNAIELHVEGKEKKQGFFFSTQRAKAGLEDKLYVGNIHRIENHLYWNDEELQDDDQIVNVVWVDGPITRDGGACSYGTKEMRDQVLYANTIPQVVGHLFYINTPGGESSARNDYEMMINDCRENGKPTVAFVDGLCASSGVNLASRCDRVIVMSPHDEFGCIGSMAAFWATPDGAIDQDGTRYVEIVGEDCPAKNDWYREAAQGDYEKLKALINKSTEEFHQSVRENRPLVEDWMLTGDIFEAQQLIPALVDEIGDYNRAIECVFQLADETLPAARFAVEKPDGNGDTPEGKEPEEMATLNEQQKAAINTSKGNLMMAEDGHVTTEVPGFFGPETREIATPKNDKEMTDEEKKAQEAAAAQAAQEETQEPAVEPAQEPAQEPAAEPAQKPAAEPAQEPAAEPAAEKDPEAAAEPAADATGTEAEGVQQYKPGEPADLHFVEQGKLDEAQAEIDRIADTLHNAESMIEQKDKEIAESAKTIENLTEQLDAAKAELETARGGITEKNATIEAKDKVIEENGKTIAELQEANDKLTKQVADLKAEVKELSEKPDPMINGDAGVPQGNGTGAAPKVSKKRLTREEMTYRHCREVAKEREAAKQN